MKRTSTLLAALLCTAACEKSDSGSHDSGDCSTGRVWSDSEGQCVDATDEDDSTGDGTGGTSNGADDVDDDAEGGGDATEDDAVQGAGGQGGTGQDAGGQGGRGGATDEGSSPYGTSCETSNECTEDDAPYCLVDPETQMGNCVAVNCTPGSCKVGMLCCDCSESEFVSGVIVDPTCFPEPGVQSVTDYGCVCE